MMVSSEAHPFAKTGGLADVVGALPFALQAFGDEAAVVMPRYRSIDREDAELVREDMRVWLNGGFYSVNVYLKVHRGVKFYFIDCHGLFDRDGIYGDRAGDFGDNALRFAVLCLAALGVARFLFRTDIFHCHDWQAALLPLYRKFYFPNDRTFVGTKSLFSIHNLAYQGYFPRRQLEEIGLDDRFWNAGALEFHGGGNLMKAGLLWSDALSTVSPTYAREIQTAEFGCGMEGILQSRSTQLAGILNGVDYEDWSPETDRFIAAPYSVKDMAGKMACKRDLLEYFGFPLDDLHLKRPIVGVVSRLAEQKGLDLVGEMIVPILDEELTLIVLGSGDRKLEDMFNHFSWTRPDKFRSWIGHNNPLAHRVEAGSDMFLMPSRYEPCGLNQMYSLRYGTLPIVHATGGLEDTVDGETGFKFWGAYGPHLLEAVRHAVAVYWNDPDRWGQMVRTAMGRDYSWNASASAYSGLYRALLRNPEPEAESFPAPPASERIGHHRTGR